MTLSILHRIKAVIQRLMAVVGILLVLGILLFVRAPKSEIPGRTHLSLWFVTGADESEPQAPIWFNKSQDNLAVQPIGVPFLEIERKFLTCVVGGVPPDLFEYFGSVAQWSSRGALIPLDEFMERDGFDRTLIFPALWDEVTWDGRVYAIPVGTACDAFYWNKDHFREAGLDPDRPPQTWQELEEYAEKLTIRNPDGSIQRAGYVPGYWSAMATPIFIFWALQNGATFLSEDGRKVNLTSPACVEALEWEGRLFEKLGRDALIQIRASFGYGTQQGFLSGRLSMIAQKSSFVQELSKFAPDLDYGVSLFPIPPGGCPATTSGAVWIGIPEGSRHPEEAWQYIRFYTQTEIQMRAAQYAVENDLVAFFPANIEVASSPIQMTVPHMQVFLDSMQYAHTPTVVALAHTVFWREYGNAWDEVMRGRRSARDALRRAEQEIQRALDDQLIYNDFYREYLERHPRSIITTEHKQEGTG